MAEQTTVVPAPEENGGQTSTNAAKPSTSQRKAEANRRNAQKSTGPRTDAGKARSATNAFKHGFFAKRLFHNEEQWKEAEEYNQLAHWFIQHFQPKGFLEEFLVERIVTDAVRLTRLIAVEQKQLDAAVWYSKGSVMRYLTTADRQLQKKIHELERLQEKRKAEEANTPEVEEYQEAEEPDAAEAVDAGNPAWTAATAPGPSDEASQENLGAIVEGAISENAGTKPTATELGDGRFNAGQNSADPKPEKAPEPQTDTKNAGTKPSGLVQIGTEALASE